MIFASPWVLIIIPLFLAFFFMSPSRNKLPGFIFPTDDVIKTFRGSRKVWLVRNSDYIRVLCLILIAVALARPQYTKERTARKEGIAIAIAIDASSTMLADDMTLGLEDLVLHGDLAKTMGEGKRELRRIDAVKEVANNFVDSREDDLVGLVAFAAQAFVVCPPTFDHEWFKGSLKRVDIGLIEDGTAIGSGILSSINMLKEVRAKNKIIILLTDGINNYGKTPPKIAAKAARAMGIKIYTIGLVGHGMGALVDEDGTGRKVFKQTSIDIDEDELRAIAKLTDGEYFRAKDMKGLRESYKEIDKLEKTAIERRGHEQYLDIFPYFLIPAFVLLLLDIVLRNTFLRRIP
ncbi:MAG: VWA domain-containing protein [Candidatus Omnitrophica bacterium]|nr:VWA domain-containing protein [Candidatus Omnitrophota bacterium]